MELDAIDGYYLLIEAIKANLEDRLYKLYVSMYPYMLLNEEEISFEEFKSKMIDDKSRPTAKAMKKDKDKIMGDVESILNNFNRTGGEAY